MGADRASNITPLHTKHLPYPPAPQPQPPNKRTSTSSLARSLCSTALPSLKRPRSMRELGVSGSTREPMNSSAAGTPARPRLRRQPHSTVWVP